MAHPPTHQPEIQIWTIDRLKFYIRNPRKNDHVVDRMCGSIREFGLKIPVLARSDGEVVDGHLRLKAARKLGITEIPVILCDEWTPAQVKAFRLLVNRSVTWADWDDDLLKLELQELQELDFDLNLSGFDLREIDEFLLAPLDAEQADEVPGRSGQPGLSTGRLMVVWRAPRCCVAMRPARKPCPLSSITTWLK
jgi:ParB-like chromosome segregation protein Spo0J